MSMHRRELMKRAGIVSAGIAAGAHLHTSGASAQDADLEFWDTLNSPPRSDVADTLAADFGEANGVSVEHRGWSTEELVNTLPRSVEGNQGPDVAQVNNGEALAGPMIRAGQLVSLAPYVEQYGWDAKIPEGLRARASFSEDGTAFGEGVLWGVPAEAEIVGFYYNRAIFEEHGLGVPSTVADFESLNTTLREAGVEPIAFGTLDKWQAIHIFGELQGLDGDLEFLDNLIYRRNDASFDHPSMLTAAEKLVEWQNNGFFLNGHEGVNGDDAIPMFTSGMSAMLMQGSWAAGAVQEAMGDDAGFFLMPPTELPATNLHVGGIGIPYSITTNAEDPDLAAALIDSFVSEEAFTMFVEAGLLPIGEVPADLITEGTLSGDLFSGWNTAVEANTIGHYLDWATPDFYDFLTARLQELLAGQIEPQEFVDQLQEHYAASFE